MKSAMTKKKIIKSFDNLSPELQDLFKEKYPYGYSNSLIRLTNAKNENFFVVPLDLEDVTYMVKVKLEKITQDKEEDDVAEDNTEDDRSSNQDYDGFGGGDEQEDSGKSEKADPSYEPDIDF